MHIICCGNFWFDMTILLFAVIWTMYKCIFIIWFWFMLVICNFKMSFSYDAFNLFFFNVIASRSKYESTAAKIQQLLSSLLSRDVEEKWYPSHCLFSVNAPRCQCDKMQRTKKSATTSTGNSNKGHLRVTIRLFKEI